MPAKVDHQDLKFALIGLTVGTLAAGAVMALIDNSNLTRLLGSLVIAAVGLALSGWSVPVSKSNLLFTGSGAGFLGTIAGVHAPPIALLCQGLTPERVRGAIQTFVGLGNGFSIPALVLVGRFSKQQLFASLLLVPGVLVGL